MNSKSELLNKIFKRKSEIVSREIAGETILVPITGNLANMQRIFSLNPVANFIWHQLDGEKTLREISEDIISAFDVEKEQADKDINEFISALLKDDLIMGVN
jgi:hypothetical protein